MAFESTGVNYAANLPAYDSKELQLLFGTTVSEYIIEVYRRELNLQLILDINMDVDLCRSLTYLCDDDTGSADMADSALDGPRKTQFINMPRIKTFSGFCKGGFQFKLAVEQLECIWQQDILKNWFNQQLNRSIENGRMAIMARWYRQLITAAHPKNCGNNAGLVYGGQRVGTPARPILFNAANADDFFIAMNSVIKQMPKAPSNTSMYGTGIDADNFLFGPSIMENVLMQTDEYNRYDSLGSCGECWAFKDTFNKYPRGIVPLTGDCVESYSCDSAGNSHVVYPVLFGRRYKGAKAALRIKSIQYTTQDQDSVFYQTTFYHHMHVYDPRFLGLAYIVIDQKQPEVIDSCDPTA